MNCSKPDTDVGGGEMKRATSSALSMAKSDGASEARSSRSTTRAPAQHRQRALPVARDDVFGRRWPERIAYRELRRKASFP